MARSRDVILLAALITGALVAPGLAASSSTMPTGATPLVQAQYYHPERPYYRPPPRQPRRVCWTEYRRVLAGYDRYGRPVFRRVPRRVCGYR
jgi:hypothetical protein